MTSKLLLLFIFFPFIAGSLSQLIPNGSRHIYKFENTVELLDLKQTPFSSGYRIESKLTISSVWNSNEYQLLQFELEIPKLLIKSSDNRKGNKFTIKKSPKLSEMTNLKSFILLENNKIVKFLTNKDSNELSSINLQRGLSSLFQFQKNDETISEHDSSGQCNVLYQSKSSKNYRKIKTDCRNWDLRVNFRVEKALGIGSKSYQEIIYELDDSNVLNKIESIETHSRFVKSKPDAGSKIKSNLNLNFLSSDNKVKQNKAKDIKELMENLLTENKEFELELEIDGNVSNINRDLKKHIKSHLSEMSNYNFGKIATATTLAKLLPLARIATTEEFIKILKSPSTQESQYQLIDLLGATQTIESHKAFCKTFKFDNEDDLEASERYLQALAISTRPNMEIFIDLYDRLTDSNIENENLRDTLIQTLSSIASKYSKFSQNGFSDDMILKYKNYLLDILKDCPDTICKLVYIRGLQNLRDPSTIDILIEIALKQSIQISVSAMKALRNFPINLFNNKNRLDFDKIFYQATKKFDTTARILALDILLDLKPSKDQLTKLLTYLNSNDKAFEVKTYLIQKIRMISEKCNRFESLVKEVLKDNPKCNNYNVIAQKGLTTALYRTLSTVPGLNETLLSVQETFNGVLKQGTVDLTLNVDNEEFSTFKLGLYTSGLSSFVSQGSSETVVDDDDELVDEQPTTAGMEIIVQGVQYRPLVFFNGQSELMGHVWSGTASEPTTAYQATTIHQDHEDYILLQNGATIYLNIIGAKSIDINGQIQFSLWNRNAHTEIIQNSGISILGSMKYGTSFIKMENKFSVSSEPTLNTVVDVDFYSDILLCVQLSKPDLNLWHKIEKSVEIIESKFKYKNSINIKYNLAGKTLALNHKNNIMCNKIAT